MPRTFAQFYPALYEQWMLAAGPTEAGGMDYLQYAEPNEQIASLGGPNHYDPLLIYHLVREYTGDPAWDEVIDAARWQWLTLFLSDSAGSTQAYHAMSGGLRKHYEKTGDLEAGEMVALMHRRSAAADNYSLTYLSGWPRSRDAAFGTIVHLDAESIGCTSRAKRAQLKTIMFGHLDQWFDPANATWPTGLYGPNCMAIQPFMVGLTLKSLTEYWDRFRDSDIPAKVKFAIDSLWDDVWNLNSNFGNNVFVDPNAQAFPYWNTDTNDLRANGCGGTNNSLGYDGGWQPQPAAALNALIAHAYIWYALHGATTQAEQDEYLDRGEVISAGVSKPGHQKEYNQAHLYSVVAFRHRDEILTPPALATTYTLEAPSTAEGRANELSDTFKVELGGRVTNPVTITLSDGAATGTFLPASLILTTDHPVGRFRYAPAAAEAGTAVTISATNGSGLTNPSAVSYDVTTVAPFATGTEIIPPAWLPGAQGWSGVFTVRLKPAGSVLPRSKDAYFSVIRGSFNPPKDQSGTFDNTKLQARTLGTWVSATHEGTFQTWIPAGRTEPFTVKFVIDDSAYSGFGSSLLFAMTANGEGAGTAAGTSTATGVGARFGNVEAVGTAAGSSHASAIAAGAEPGIGTAAGTSTASAVGSGGMAPTTGDWHDPTRTVIRSLITAAGAPDADPERTTVRAF